MYDVSSIVFILRKLAYNNRLQLQNKTNYFEFVSGNLSNVSQEIMGLRQIEFWHNVPILCTSFKIFFTFPYLSKLLCTKS